MTQPNDPTEALSARPLPGDGAATARLGHSHPQPPTEPTVRLAPDDATVRLATGDATVHLGTGDATVHLAADDRTVHLGVGDATVHLAADGRTVHLGTGDATVHLAAGEPTAHLAPAPSAGRPVGGEPTVGAGEATTHLTGGGQTGHRPPAQPIWGERTERGTVAPTGGARTTAAGSGTIFTARTGPAAAPVGGEVRFGPGVPATPPAAPAWPVPTPPRRRRSVWRTVTSVLSTLLTVALLAAVGLYLWQRLSPLEITGVTVSVPEPAGQRCDVTVDVVATVTTNGRAGEIRYQWLRSGSAPGSLLTERVGRGQRTVALTLRWAFSGVGTTTETATVNVTSPSPVQAQAPVTYDCRR